MSGPALAYAHRYAAASAVVGTPAGTGLRIATWGGEQERPQFFRGRLVRARRAAARFMKPDRPIMKTELPPRYHAIFQIRIMNRGNLSCED